MEYTVNYILKRTLIRVKATKEKIRKQKNVLMLIQYKIKRNLDTVHHNYIFYRPI